MGDTEEYFPRGGKKPTVQYFKQSSNFLAAAEQGERKKKKQKRKPEGDDGYLSDEAYKDVEKSRNCGPGITYQTAKAGLVILGRIRQIMETKLLVMTPGKMMGFVMACHVSEPYNKLLEEYVNNRIEEISDLSSMFRCGQYVALKVLETKQRNLMMTTMPQHVNANLTTNDLQNGCILQAAVSSVEDHGYVMDIGVPGTRAFMSKKSSNPEVTLDVGHITWCCVKSVDSVVKLSSRLEDLQGAMVRKTGALLPGTGVDLTVDQALDDGIQGHIFKDTTAYVQRNHADTVKGKKPTLGQRVRARVLYVMPTLHTPFLSMRNIFESSYPDLAGEQSFKEGDIVDHAQVLKIMGRSILFKLGPGSLGMLSLRRVEQHDDLTDDQVLASSYPLGSTHKVRVLCYNLCDYNYSVTDKSDVINEKYFSFACMTAGEIVTGTVNAVTDTSVTVQVGRVQGYVPHTHLSDSGVFIDPKKATTSKLPKKKFKVGQEVTARVLTVDIPKTSLILTLKPSLLDPDLQVLQSYQQADIGKAYTGVIKYIRPDYVLVSFFNGVHAYVPRNYVSKDPEINVAEVFHLGQIVNCTIIKVDVEAKKMTGSLVTTPFWPNKKREFTQKRKQTDSVTDEPTKKKRKSSKSESETEIDHSKANKKKKDKYKTEGNDSDIEVTNKKDRVKKKSDQVSEDENIVVPKKKKDKKHDLTEETQSETEIDHSKANKKKKDKYKTEGNDSDIEVTNKKDRVKKKSDQVSEDENIVVPKKKKDKKHDLTEETQSETENKVKSKKKKDKKHSVSEESETDNTTEPKRKKDKKQEVSEESDAIDTDIQEAESIIAVQDLELLDLTDCVTTKKCKRKVVSLLKALQARSKQIDSLEKKIQSLEEKGLNIHTKKQHTAFHIKKLLTEERLKKVIDVLKTAQGMLKNFGGELGKKDYKKKFNEGVLVSAEDGNQKTDAKDIKSVEEKQRKKLRNVKVVENLEPVLDVPSAKDFWADETENITSNVQEEDSSSSDEEQTEQPKKKRKKLTVAEKLAKAREEEDRVREMERKAIESESQPRSSDQFERALLANPDCSQLWIAYMAFHLQATEIEKARAVGRKALTTISFREEQERLNVWLAMLNCEHRFGTQESQQKTLEEALQKNDPLNVHSKLLDILIDTGKQQELITLTDLMLRKYKREPTAYMRTGDACYKLGLVDKARSVMQKAISVLEKKEHVSILVHFALLERSNGARERAEALFEQVLAVYPQRVDVCAVYADMLVKEGDVERVRQVMERMTSQKLPARKMKILYKKWIEVEEKIGDKTQVETIKQRAMEFIEKAKF